MSSSPASKLTMVERPPIQDAARHLQRQGLSSILAALFSARGVRDVSEVRGKLSNLEPVSTLKNAVEMGQLLADCVQKRSRVLIVSDYDCDGATACAVLVRAFQGANMNFGFLVPHRIKNSYGLTPSIVEEAAALNPKPEFIITVDNGISSKAGVQRARELGIEVLVTDHHLPPDDRSKIPDARLIVNPQQDGCDFKSKAIAGCGVAWYVACALFHELRQRNLECTFRPADLLPFVALGTVADVVKLDANNRILVREGLDRIRRGECSHGIKELAGIAVREGIEAVTCRDIGFGIGPRINAAGRLAHMNTGVECLTTKDPERASVLAKELDATNQARKEMQEKMRAEAAKIIVDEKVTSATDRYSVIVYNPDWHEGVVGIVAGRIKEDAHRPAFVLTNNAEGHIKGSGRAIDGFHLKHALDEINAKHPEVLLAYGGHAPAAGVTIRKDCLEIFKEAFEDVCRRHLTPEMLVPRLDHDGPLPEYAFNEQAITEMDREVWGQGFPPPMFVDSFAVKGLKTMGTDDVHLKVMVKRGSFVHDVVAWNKGHCAGVVPDHLQVAFTPQINRYGGRVSVQLMTRHLLNVVEPEVVPHVEHDGDAPATTRSPRP